MTRIVTAGEVAFSNVTEHEAYQGQSTGRYSLVVRLSESDASALSDMGIKLKDYEGVAQRKFVSKYHIPVVDLDNNPVGGEVPYGSKVRILWKAGPAHPVHGVPCYIDKVRVVEFAEGTEGGEEPSDF